MDSYNREMHKAHLSNSASSWSSDTDCLLASLEEHLVLHCPDAEQSTDAPGLFITLKLLSFLFLRYTNLVHAWVK